MTATSTARFTVELDEEFEDALLHLYLEADARGKTYDAFCKAMAGAWRHESNADGTVALVLSTAQMRKALRLPPRLELVQ